MDLIAYVWVIWLIVALLCFIIEMVTLEFTFLMLGLGSIVGLVASLTGLPWWAQILIAAGAALLLLFLVRPSLLQRLQRGGEPALTNVDAIIGMQGEVTKTFVRSAGEVTLQNGETWSARVSTAAGSMPTRDLDVGERVVVTAISGASVVVVPAQR